MSKSVLIKVERKHLLAFAGFIVFVGMVAGVIAYTASPGTTPNPGHGLLTIQGYFSDDASLLQSLAKLQQRVSGTCAAGSSIREITATGTVVCEADDEGSGGGGGLVIWGNVGSWMTERRYTGTQVCANIGKSCTTVYYEGLRSDQIGDVYYGKYSVVSTILCSTNVLRGDWSTTGASTIPYNLLIGKHVALCQ